MKKKDTGPADALEYIMSGKQLTAAIETKRGDFTVAFPLPRDLREISVSVARMLLHVLIVIDFRTSSHRIDGDIVAA